MKGLLLTLVVLTGSSAASAQGYTTMPFGDGYIHQPVPEVRIGRGFAPEAPTYTTMPYGSGYITRPVDSGGFAEGFINGLSGGRRLRERMGR